MLSGNSRSRISCRLLTDSHLGQDCVRISLFKISIFHIELINQICYTFSGCRPETPRLAFAWKRAFRSVHPALQRRNVMRPIHIIAALLLLVLLTGGSALFAQTATGEVSGTITDPTGAFVAGAKVTLTNRDTGISRTTTTNGSGLYVFINLQPGRYVLVA